MDGRTKLHLRAKRAHMLRFTTQLGLDDKIHDYCHRGLCSQAHYDDTGICLLAKENTCGGFHERQHAAAVD